MKYDEMSNSELKIKMVNLENEYESIKTKLEILLEKMESLDTEYDKINKIYLKRTRGLNYE